jgi:hypothetical protein
MFAQNLKRVAPWGRVAAACGLVVLASCDLMTSPEPNGSPTPPSVQAISPAPLSAAIQSTLSDLGGLSAEDARQRFEALPADLQTAVRTSVQSAVDEIGAVKAEAARKQRFDRLTPEMQAAVRLAAAVARTVETEEKVPASAEPAGRARTLGKHENGTEWFPMSCCHTVTAFNCFGCPMFSFSQTVFYNYCGCGQVFVVAQVSCGFCMSPCWCFNGVVARSSVNFGVFADVFAQGMFSQGFFLGQINAFAFAQTRVFASGGATFFGHV